MAGRVHVNGAPATKAGTPTADDAAVELIAPPRYVSRGGEKLETALAAFGVDVTGERCLDVGASTGGFTDCLLQHGAAASQQAPSGLALHTRSGELNDFADTAALVSALDLVIGVDTAVIHLAGALGQPVWLLNRADTDWRWLAKAGSSTLYPTLREFRQESFSDWGGVITDVQRALADFGRSATPC